jgi:hypothetical protein
MIFARTRLPNLDPKRLTGLLEQADVVQLDIASPTAAQPRSVGSSHAWSELSRQMAQIHKAIYLRPELCLVTNTGNQSVIDCITSQAEFLVAHRSGDLPISAIRGGKLLADLETIVPLLILPVGSKVLDAHVEIGAGPIAAALAEGARIVVAGAYDASAPLTGAAVARGWCGWQDHEHLALLTTASQFEDTCMEVKAGGSVELDRAASEQLDRVRALGIVAHADAQIDYRELTLESTQHDTLRPTNVRSASRPAQWNARILVESGYRATALVVGVAAKINELLEGRPVKHHSDSVCCNEYYPAAREHAHGDALLKIEYRSDAAEACQEFLEWLQLSLLRMPGVGALVAPPPSVEHLTETISAQVPADRVTISVDTRPAREWL